MKKSISIAILSIIVISTISIFLVIRKRSAFKRRILRLALHHYRLWQGTKELSSKVSSLLSSYWKSVGLEFSFAEMQNPAVHSSYPWSSAFISFLFKSAGAGSNFPYSSSHAGYFQWAKKNRSNPKAPLLGFRISEYAPAVGDLIVFTRQSGAGYDTQGFFSSHGELVIEKGPGYIKSIGGNVSDAVRISKFTTNSKGFLTTKERPFFMVIKNQIR